MEPEARWIKPAAQQSQQTVEGRRILESVIDRDDRVQVPITDVMPWSTVCALRITAQSGLKFVGTGCLVSARLVLTAGHCVFDTEQGGWPKFIEVIPGCNEGYQPAGSCFSSEFRTVRGWMEMESSTHDYGAIVLPQNCRFGDVQGFLGVAEISRDLILRTELTLTGYPLDKPRGTQWTQTKSPGSLNGRTLTYAIDTEGGQSGSPLWCFAGGERYVVAIHTSGGAGRNFAVKIDNEVFRNILLWIREAA
ncbi:MAG: trypsin-like serine protease [Thermomicrobiales bacterium]